MDKKWKFLWFVFLVNVFVPYIAYCERIKRFCATLPLMFCGTVDSGHIADCPIRPASLVTINIMELLDKTWQRETISSNKAAVTWPIVDTINYY